MTRLLYVPTGMQDITIEQYNKVTKIKAKEGTRTWLLKAICILCNITLEQARTLTIKELNKVGDILGKMNDVDANNQELQRKIEYKGIRYGFHPNLSDLTVGEFADLETFCNKDLFENLNEVMSILYRPIELESKDFYSIEEYKGKVLPDYWNELTMDIVLGAINFFLSIGQSLVKGLHNYSKEEAIT